MVRIVWITDIHLNFLSRDQVAELIELVPREHPDAILLGGDIGEADSVATLLETLASAWTCPIYFVLGNHDFYGGSIQRVREEARAIAEASTNLHYLTVQSTPLELTTGVGLIGHDGWADARAGDYLRSLVMMNDYRLIDELRNHDKASRRLELQRLGDEAGDHIELLLRAAVREFDEVILLTHVPPFREACWYDGRVSDDEWVPHFSCMAVGHAIRDVMSKQPQKRLTVLCGHTHGGGTCQPLTNVTVKTGFAEYGTVAITEVIDF